MNNGLRVAAREERIKEYILPQRIVCSEGTIERPDSLLAAKDLQIMLDEDDVCVFKGKSFIILDFGKEIHGGVRMLVHLCNGTPMLRVRFGESVSECCSDAGKSSATNDHSIRDFCVPTTLMSDMEWGCSGFRFIRIDVLEEDCEVRIKSILATFVYRDLDQKGSFECSDKRWNQIYETAAYTVKLNMQHHLWDGIKRDRLVWMGDIHPETKGIISLFGSDKCVEEAIDLLRERTPLPKFMNNMPSYSMWYLIILADYYIQNGNADYVRMQSKYVANLTRYLADFVDEKGKLVLSDYFLDWPSLGKPGAEAGVYALFDLAMQKAAVLMKVIGMEEPAIRSARERLNKTLTDGGQKQVIAFRSLAGHADAEVSAERLAENGAHGLSTFMSYYISRAMFEGGKREESMSILREYYGAMLERGATSFWEDFDIDWLKGSSRIDELPAKGEKDIHGDYGAYCYSGFRHSLCHGWSCGPVPFLTEFVLGVRIAEAGCRTLEIKPFLGDLEWVKGSYPTPFGVVEIEHRRENGTIVSSVKAPSEVKIVCDTLAK